MKENTLQSTLLIEDRDKMSILLADVFQHAPIDVIDKELKEYDSETRSKTYGLLHERLQKKQDKLLKKKRHENLIALRDRVTAGLFILWFVACAMLFVYGVHNLYSTDFINTIQGGFQAIIALLIIKLVDVKVVRE